jgi:hypothetical protein
MFVALRTTDRSRVTSLAVQWDGQLDALQELAAGGQLVCPGCEQLLWLRIGLKRRRLFAHRQLADCPLAHQSPEVLEVKAQLYQWLESKYPDKVHLDLPLGVPGWDKLLDLLVEATPSRKFTYWAFDRQRRARYPILAYQSLPDVHVHFIHTQSALVQRDTFRRDLRRSPLHHQAAPAKARQPGGGERVRTKTKTINRESKDQDQDD